MGYVEEGNAKKEVTCTEDKANIFLIGDSIREGYCNTVKAELEDMANVFTISENCRNSQYIITCLRYWCGRYYNRERMNLVQFNCGHWDIAHWNGEEKCLTSKEDYAKNIEVIIRTLRKYFVNAKIVFATTTPMNPNGEQGVNPRYNPEIDEYNKIAVEVAEKNGAIINDLNEFTRDWDSNQFEDYCHFSKEGFEIVGKEVARRLKSYL